MAITLFEILKSLLPDSLEQIFFPKDIHDLLTHLSTDTWPPAAGTTPEVKGTANDSVGFAHLDVAPMGPAIPFELRATGPAAAPDGFQLDLKPVNGLLRLPDACAPAAIQVGPDGQRTLVAAGTGHVSVTLNGADPLAMRIEGSVGSQARKSLVALDAEDRGVMTVGIDPPAFMLGTQGFGIHLPGGLTLDSSSSNAPEPVEHGGGRRPISESPAWQGIAIRKAELFLPANTPLIGAGPIPIEFDVGMPNGLYGHTEVHIPEEGKRPAFDVTVTWDDPGATSLASALPSAIEIRTLWNLSQTDGGAGVGTIDLLGGRPLRVTGRFARTPGTGDMEFGLVVEAGGDEGLLTVQGTSTVGKVVVTATALATAFIADAEAPNQPEYDGFGATLHALLVAASGLSAFVENGSMTVHGVEIDAGLAAAGTKLTLRVDYSVDVLVTTIDLGFMSIGMKPQVPMRLRYRNVRLLVDFAQSGLDRYHLSFGEADVGVEDAGGWQIQSPGTLSDLFDVLGSRSGHGSQWFEIDLRFALDLGPVKVSGATVRVTLGPGGALEPSLRGLDASLTMPGLFSAEGKASLGSGQLDLAMAASIIPLNVGAFARLSYGDCGGFNKLVFALGVDLPGPIPLANSGLGLFGLGGIFGVNASLPTAPPGRDPVEFQFEIDPLDPAKYACASGGSVFGLGAVVGTAPDLGWTFSARAVVVIGVPDFAFRASLDGKVLAERVEMGSFGTQPSPGLSFIGLLLIGDDGVTIALRGHYEIPVLFTMDVPFGAFFPAKGPADSWYVRLGSDGEVGRTSPGPIQTKLLPDLLDVGGWGYLMVQGNGIQSLGGDPSMTLNGFAVGFGAGFNAKYGVPLIYLEVSASAVIGVGTNPFFLAGKGHLAGSLHLGPVSIGASAEIMLQVGPALDDAWVKFEVCGEVDLFFFSLEGCVTIEIGEKSEAIPDPAEWPLVGVALSDHMYTKLGDALPSGGMPNRSQLPTVWPDVIPILQFTVGPADALQPGPFRDKVYWNPAEVGDGVVGNERLSYTYGLTEITLTAIDPATGTETPVTGPWEAAWQKNKAAVPGQRGARELALMTWETALWTRKLVDGAANDPHDPVPELAGHCHSRATAEPGWVLGQRGTRHGPGVLWKLPAEPATGPYASAFSTTVIPAWNNIPIDESTVALLPFPFPVQLSGPAPLGATLTTSEREFVGAFGVPHVVGVPKDIDPNVPGLSDDVFTATLTFSEPLFDPLLALLLPKWPSDFADRHVRVELIGPNGLSPMPVRGDQSGIRDDFTRLFGQAGGPYVALRIVYRPVIDLRILGLRAVTASAAQAAAEANAADAAWSDEVEDKATTVTPRAMLDPGTVYRINVTVSGQGKRAETGKVGTVISHTDSYWFQTAEMSGPAPSKGQQYLQTTSAVARLHYDEYVFAPSVLRKTDRFDPTYLQRYILSWMPADKNRFWFLKDPVGVQMSVNHVPDLAAIYDHDTKVRVRRTDPTKGNPDPFEQQEFPATFLFQAAVSIHQPASDLRLYELTSLADGCPYPAPGATLGGRPELQPLSQYQLHLAFPFLDSGGSGQSGGAEIQGVVFSTSRYDGPLPLLADLGFGGSGLTGDVPVSPVAVFPGDSTADGAIEQTLSRLGLGRWPTADAARSTGLWIKDGSTWKLHGVLLEAPEPIHRPDNLGLENFGGRVLVLSLANQGRRFEQVIRSASGDRLLFLTGTPFVPGATLDLSLKLQEVPLETATVAGTATVTCPIGAIPGFAEDLP